VLHDVKNASSMLGTGGVFVFEAVQKNSSDLRAQLPKVSGTLDSLTNRLATLEREALKSSDLTNIRDGLLNDSNIRTEALRADLMGQLARKADAAALNETRLRLDREVRRIDTDMSRLRP
jgi:hypothetical protein